MDADALPKKKWWWRWFDVIREGGRRGKCRYINGSIKKSLRGNCVWKGAEFSVRCVSYFLVYLLKARFFNKSDCESEKRWKCWFCIKTKSKGWFFFKLELFCMVFHLSWNDDQNILKICCCNLKMNAISQKPLKI